MVQVESARLILLGKLTYEGKELCPGICNGDAIAGGTIWIHLGRPNKTALCGLPVFLFTDRFNPSHEICPDCLEVYNRPPARPIQRTLSGG